MASTVDVSCRRSDAYWLRLGRIGRVSVSFGVTQLLAGDSMADLIRRADGLLYRAKALGRNRVETDM